MNDIKTDNKTEFKQWLQKNFSKSTASSYYGLVQKIFDKNFDDSQDWQKYSNEIIPLLARYFEFANREYKLDRVTTWYALEYFDKIVGFIYPKQNKTYNYELDVKISIYDGQKDYPVIVTSLYNLSDNIKYIARELYNYNVELNIEHIESSKFMVSLQNACEKITSVNIGDVAIHIEYQNAGNSSEKTALSQYCNFLYATTHNIVHLYPSNELITLIRSKNPNKTINGNYRETRSITGLYARQVTYNPKVRRYTHLGYVYSTKDVAEIFDIDFNTASDLMNRFGGIFKIKTVLDNYYSDKATNVCLRRYHHYKNKKVFQKYSTVDYLCDGYKWWYNRKEAMNFLGIKKAAFYSHIAENCLYINYAKGAPRYYLPELEYFKNLPEIQKIAKRKYHKNNMLNTNQTFSNKTCI